MDVAPTRTKERNPEKQSRIEGTLGSLKSTMYGDYSGKVKSGTYRRNRNTLKKDLKNVGREIGRLTRKKVSGTAKQAKGYDEKIKKLETLQEIMGEETNVENLENNSNNESTPLGSVKENEKLEGLEEKFKEQAAIENKNENDFSNLPPLEEITPPVQENIIEEIREGENAVEAVENVKRGEEKEKEIKYTFDCETLYDPCTKEPLKDLKALEKRVRDIKKGKDNIPFGNYGLKNSTTNYEFLTNVFINPEISLDDMVSFKLSEGRAKPGTDIFEVLSRLFVFFGGIENVNPREGGNYRFMDKLEEGGRRYDDTKKALQSMKCIASKGSGVSDITLVQINENKKKDVKSDSPYCEVDCDVLESENIKTYAMSVKWYTDEKSAEHYDLEKLYTLANLKIQSKERKPVGIIVFLKSKKDFQIAHNRSYRQYVKEIGNSFFGWNEDVKPFLEGIRKNIFELAYERKITINQALESQYFIQGAKPILSLQLHQDIIVKGICDAFQKNEDNRYLVGVLPRGGKTFIAGGIMREYLKQTNVKNLTIFWITAAPNETKSQVQEELLERFQDFNDFEFIPVKDINEMKKNKPHTVFFSSSQLLNLQTSGKAKNRPYLENLLSGKDSLGLVFFDEAHKTGTGQKTSDEIGNILKAYSNNVPFIFLTATYFNILFDYEIKKENTFIWDYTDVLMSRGLATESEQQASVDNLKTRFGEELVNTIIEKRQRFGETLETMADAYIGFPDLYFLSADFQEETLERFQTQNQYRPDSGFSLNSIFAIKPDSTLNDIKTSENTIKKDAYKIFNNLENPRNIISLLTPKGGFEEKGNGGDPLKQTDPLLEPTILGRIDKMSSESKSRFRLDEKPTLLMFMPTGGIGSNIYYLLCAWASLLMNHSWWKANYEVACVVNEETPTSINSSDVVHIINKNPKQNILELERKLHCSDKKKGLVILAGQKLSMGISLPCTDVVFLFNESKSPDDIIQKMYRGLTPSIDKKSAYIVDLNPVRTLAALYGYTRASHEASNTSSQLLNIIYDTYSWDADIFEYNLKKGSNSKPLTFQQRLRDLFEIAQADTTNEYRINEDIGGHEKKLGENIRRTLDPYYISKIQSIFTGKKMEGIFKKLGLKDDAKIKIENGKLVIRGEKKPKEGEPVENENEKIDIVIDNFIQTVADFIKYLAITSSKSTLEEALKEYETKQINAEGTSLQSNVLKLVRSRTNIKGLDNNEVLSDLIEEVVKEFSSSTSREIFRQMKGKIDEPSTRKDKVLQIIDKGLRSTRKGKKDFGEVFTPLNLVEDMLSHLSLKDWSNPKLKWLDPANGIGNFPITIFYKLDEGLKSWESNEKKRRKHIIENMLYMMELQSNNTRVSRNLFSSLCEGCKPNIWTVNTITTPLEKIKDHFKVDEFDRIIGNPPFQDLQKADKKRGGGDELYMKFVNKSLELLKENGYLVFVHPPSWRKPESDKSKNSGMFNLMAHDNQIIYLEIHSSKDGMEVFKAATRYDYYILKKTPSFKITKIKDINGDIIDIDLKDFSFLPNYNIKNVEKLFPKRGDNKCEKDKCILAESSAYETRKKWVSPEKTTDYKYPLIHTTPKTGPRIFYSNTKDKGLFGIPKVIFGDGGINEPVIDLDGKYGMTQHAMAIAISNEREANKLSKFLKSNFFKNILSACMWSSFQIDWRLFTYFKDNFWDIDVNLDEKIIDIGIEELENEEREGGSTPKKLKHKTRKNKKPFFGLF